MSFTILTRELFDEASSPALIAAGQDLELLLHLGGALGLLGHVLAVCVQPAD